MTDLSPEAVAAGEAAAAAVTGVERTEELQEQIAVAEVNATVAEYDAQEAQETAVVAAETAVIGTVIAANAAENAEIADAKAEEALSENQQLRQEMNEGFAAIQAGIDRILNPPQPEVPESTVEEVTTDDSGSAGKSSGDSVGGNKASDSSDGKASRKSPGRGFRGGRGR